jgi:hypothetical protein
MSNCQNLDIEILDEFFQISIDGSSTSQDVSNKISSIANGDWKQIISIEYNPISGQLRINYEA